MAIILDGGLATTLESHGHVLTGGLWSARVLTSDPQEVARVHREFFLAGAEIATTASYQVSALSLQLAGLDPADEQFLITLSVQVAQQARDQTRTAGLIAGSLGPYGASLGDGSEFTGDYQLGDTATTVQRLREFHRPRIAALVEAGVDLVAAETVPCAAEVEAMAEELIGVPAWVSLTPAPGGRRTRTGETLASTATTLRDLPLAAVGVNCCAPWDVPTAVQILHQATDLPSIAYPNSGETWDPKVRAWTGEPRFVPDLPVWAAGDLRLVGGCCRVLPRDIRALAAFIDGQASHSPHPASRLG